MKLLALVLLDAVLAAKFALRAQRAQRAHVASQDAASCKGNVLPADLAAGPHKTLGKAQFSDVIDADKLRSALEASQFWIVGKSWELSMTANSMRQDPVTYAFTGGGHGFLTLTVPGGVVDEVLYATDTVKSLANESGFEYRGKDAVVTDHDVILTNLCLRPKTCGSFKECLPISDFKPVEDPETPGNTREDCCIPLMCKDTQPCNSTKYVKSKDWETLQGSTEERCCTPQPCTEEVCKGSWKPKLGSGLLGSTPAECCEPRLCTEYLCSETTTRGRRIGLQYEKLQGFSDEECCEDKSCKSFNCTSSPYWSDKEKKGELRGSTFLECCETLYCEDFTCSPKTQWSNLSALLPNGEKRRGFASELCCEKLTCEAFNCSSPKLKKKPGGFERLGSTDEECCEPRLCEQYTCSSATKWVHKADVDTKKHSQAGWSDEECCDKVMCSAYSCSPATMWKPLNASYQKTAAGSTNEECCEPRFCADYTCSGDADGDGESSKYYKKVDTNHFKNKGSTDEECCVARSCSQYTTEFPSKFKRKEDKDLLGSTDAECYDPVWCKDYCCKDRSKVRKSDADRIQGSSDEECCTAP